MAESVQQKINRFYSLISNYQEGAPDTRYKSWEWCHLIFCSSKENFMDKDPEAKEKIVDLLSLNLAFYLASWGMYRGSSYLLQRDYKAHKPAIKEILNPRYNMLWNYTPNEQNINEANDLLFNREYGIYWKVKSSYANYDEGIDDEPSDTLTTKILMGTFGCIPAFDRYLKTGIGNYKKLNNITKIGDYKITQSIENKSGATESFKALALFAIRNSDLLHVNDYPIMKCVDMYFWEVGYELDLAKGLVDNTLSEKKKHSLLSSAVQLNLCDINDSFIDASYKIARLNN